MYSSALTAVVAVTGLTLIHLVNLSIATYMCVKPATAVLRGPTESRPQQANGQEGGMVQRICAGMCCCLEKNWHPVHFFTMSWASASKSQTGMPFRLG
jgi:hypothetical protein